MKSIPSAPGYFAGYLGQIWRNGCTIKPRDNGYGYLRIKLSIGNKQRDAYVHRLVCEAYHGPCPEGFQCRHYNGWRHDNRPENLSWSDRVTNERDKERHGTLLRGERVGGSVLTAEQILQARDRVSAGETVTSIAKEYGCNKITLGDAVRGKRWRHLPDPVSPAKNRRHLTPADVHKIRDLFGKETQEKIAKRFGVTRNVISQIKCGLTYADI